MDNIKLVRIDDRLLHGKVGRMWVNDYNINMIIVANDEISKDIKSSKLMDVATPLGCESAFVSLDKCLEKIGQTSDKEILVLVKSPRDLRYLVDKGLRISEVNLGNMESARDKKKIADEIFLSKEELSDLKDIEKSGISLDIRVLPSDSEAKLDY